MNSVELLLLLFLPTTKKNLTQIDHKQTTNTRGNFQGKITELWSVVAGIGF
jgi:hypothetical protein